MSRIDKYSDCAALGMSVGDTSLPPPNLPVLYRNVMDFLPSDFAREVFLWALERPGEDRMCYRAEALAREADRLMGWVQHLVGLADWRAFRAAANGVRSHILSDGQREDLIAFIMTRHANWRYGGNVKPTYAVPPA